MEDKIKEVLEKIRPVLQRDGGDIEFVELENDVIRLKLKGACGNCPMSQLTLKAVIESTIKKEIPQIRRVEAV
jgi:Fe-S cluster biogenesis protein NfuA